MDVAQVNGVELEFEVVGSGEPVLLVSPVLADGYRGVASDDPAQRSLVTLMIQTAHILGLGVVAEGVERGSQLDDLRDDRCDQAQGYLMDRPLEPTEAFARYGAVLKDVPETRA